MKVKSYIQAYISEYVTCNIFDKKMKSQRNSTPNTQEQVWRGLLSLLYHYSIYISVSSPNQSFYKYNFLKKLMITLRSEFSVTAQQKLRTSLLLSVNGFLGIFLIWFVSPLFLIKSSVCSFSPCVVFRPLVIFRHGVKTQILSKVPLCIFHDANHKSSQNDQTQVN